MVGRQQGLGPEPRTAEEEVEEEEEEEEEVEGVGGGQPLSLVSFRGRKRKVASGGQSVGNPASLSNFIVDSTWDVYKSMDIYCAHCILHKS